MHAQVEDRRKEARSGGPPRDDVFSMIIRANEEDGGKYPLDDTEVVSRSFLDSI
jgi:cytochrome P450